MPLVGMALMSSLLRLLAFNFTLLPLVNTQAVSFLPNCIGDCINADGSTGCSLLDVGCLCRATRGNFLPDIITCMHSQCDNNLDTNVLLTPLQLACQLAGAPIPASAIGSAQSFASSLASQTATSTESASGPSSSTPATSTGPSLRTMTTTVTTIRSGSTIEVAVPIIIGSATTVYGSSATGTPSGTVSAGTSRSSSSGVGASSASQTSSESTSSTATGSSLSGSSSTSNGILTLTGTNKPSSTATTASVSNTVVPVGSTSERRIDPVETNSSPFQNTNSANILALGNLWILFIGMMACYLNMM